MTMTHILKYYKDGYKLIYFCTICGQEEEDLQKPCIPIETQHMRMARLLDLCPSQPETWPRDILDRLIAFENEKGETELLIKITQLSGKNLLTSKI